MFLRESLSWLRSHHTNNTVTITIYDLKYHQNSYSEIIMHQNALIVFRESWIGIIELFFCLNRGQLINIKNHMDFWLVLRKLVLWLMLPNYLFLFFWEPSFLVILLILIYFYSLAITHLNLMSSQIHLYWAIFHQIVPLHHRHHLNHQAISLQG